MNAPDPLITSAAPDGVAMTGAERARQQALARLDRSRIRLAAYAMPQADGPERPGGAAASLRHGGVAGLWRHLRRRAARLPGVEPALTLIEHWWQRHPLRMAAQAVGDAVVPHVAPVVRRHPGWVAAAAGGITAAVIALRPWRDPRFGPAVRRTPRRVGLWMWAQLRTLPMQTLIATLVAAGAAASAAPRARPAPQPEPQP